MAATTCCSRRAAPPCIDGDGEYATAIAAAGSYRGAEAPNGSARCGEAHWHLYHPEVTHYLPWRGCQEKKTKHPSGSRTSRVAAPANFAVASLVICNQGSIVDVEYR